MIDLLGTWGWQMQLISCEENPVEATTVSPLRACNVPACHCHLTTVEVSGTKKRGVLLFHQAEKLVRNLGVMCNYCWG